MNSLSSTNERKDIGILRFFILFSKIWKIGAIKRVNKMEEYVNP